MSEASNALDLLHNEAYDRPFNPQNLGHDGLVFVRNRERHSLNGRWAFTLDRFDTGLRQHWYRDCHLPIEGRTTPWDYDVENGETADVPSCWNFSQAQYFHYEGSAWYGRKFAFAPEGDGERVMLRVGAAHYDTKVFLNGKFLGNHYGGSTPFFVELTEHLEGENWLILCVNNERTLDRVPMRHCDWFNYGGVLREVDLIRLPEVFIKDFFVHLIPDGSFGRIRVALRLSDAVDGEAAFEIPELGIDMNLPLQAGRADVTFTASPDLWSPDRPKLYDVSLCFGEDRVTDRIGFREIRTEGQTILLNGEPIRLKGICAHEDDRETGRVSDDRDIRRRFAHAKELGCNFMRLAHYPHHERAAEIADEVGLLLWEEIPVYWSIAFDNEATLKDADNQLRELILRDRNRASVIAWGVGNENADTDARLAFMRRLTETARKIDPSRLVAAACLVNQKAKRIEDRLAAHLDLVGINEYYGWYEPDFADLAAIGENYDLDRPLIITETGADAPAGRMGDAQTLFSEEQMLACYDQQFETIKEIEAIKGFCPWILYDFRSERRKNSFQKGYNRKGLIDADKETKKRAFHALQTFYREVW
ncbi:MAG: glycoside hydrolase family 2 [Alphaproteobacteria bacterium]|nr:glycoside hydrolase family 2 [Alphaproteobacteria bacterium]